VRPARLKPVKGVTAARPPGPDGADGRKPLLRGEELASALPPLLVAAERVAATVAQGVHGRRRVGQGETFWQYRRYQPGDTAASIDWRQSAKSDRAYVRQTEWEAAQSVWLWRDASASMRYRSSPGWLTKREASEVLLLALASLLTRSGERIALIGDGTPPASGRLTLQRAAMVLDRRQDDSASLPGVEMLPRHAQVVWFGDFLAPFEEIRRAIAAYTRLGVQGHVMQVLDPAEMSLPFRGRVLFEGCEGEGEVLFGRAEAVRDRYLAAFALHQQGVAALVRAAGWRLFTYRIDQPAPPPLLALYLALAQRLER
jgi:uncharacterized protein (DUF58 family)